MPYQESPLLDRSHLLEGMIRVGRVTKVRTRGCIAASVTYPEHKVQTAYMQVLQRNTIGCQDFYVPEIGEVVYVLHPNWARNRGLILGSIYTSGNPPPYNDKAVRGFVFADGSYVIYDTRSGGSYQINTAGKVQVISAKDVTIQAATTCTIQAATTITLNAPTVDITGTLKVNTIIPHSAGAITANPRMTNTDGSGNGS